MRNYTGFEGWTLKRLHSGVHPMRAAGALREELRRRAERKARNGARYARRYERGPR